MYHRIGKSEKFIYTCTNVSIEKLVKSAGRNWFIERLMINLCVDVSDSRVNMEKLIYSLFDVETC